MRSAACRHGRCAQELASGDLCSCSLHHLISGRAVTTRYPHSACMRRGSHGDETHLRSGLLIWPKGGTVIIHSALTAADAATLTRCLKGLRLRGLEQGSFRDQAGCEVAPERHHQFARQRHDGDALVALAGIVVGAAAEPSGERTLRLVPQPQPGKFDGGTAGARVACLADTLVAVDPAALPWAGRQPEIACDRTPIAEVLVEHLAGQRRRERRAEAFEPEQEFAALRHLRRRRRRIRLSRRLCKPLELFAYQHQPRVLVLDLRQHPWWHCLALPIPLGRKPAQ